MRFEFRRPSEDHVSRPGATGGSGSANHDVIQTVTVDVTTGDLGTFLNTSGDLTSDLGNSGAASATLCRLQVCAQGCALRVRGDAHALRSRIGGHQVL